MFCLTGLQDLADPYLEHFTHYTVPKLNLETILRVNCFIKILSIL
jgi:hypothetical protein